MTEFSPLLVTGVVAVGGFAAGGLACLALVYRSHRQQFESKRILRELDHREGVYSRFIDQASEMWLDAAEPPHDPFNLIALAALIGKIRLSSSRPVVEAAESVMNFLLDARERPSKDVHHLAAEAPHAFMEPLDVFTAACRAERDEMLQRL